MHRTVLTRTLFAFDRISSALNYLTAREAFITLCHSTKYWVLVLVHILTSYWCILNLSVKVSTQRSFIIAENIITNMSRSVKIRLVSVALGLVGVIMLYAYIYMYGMANFENQEIPYHVALQAATESITTAGFGGHAPWESLPMNIVIIVMNITGVVLFFIGVPVAIAPFVGPIIKEAVKDEAPRETDMIDHTVLVGFKDSNELLRKKLNQNGINSLFMMDDKQIADRLHREGEEIIFVDEYDRESLSNANIENADSVIIGMEGGTDPSLVLSIKDINSEVEVISVSYTESNEKYVRRAGADQVIKPKTELGDSLASRATRDISKEINDVISDSRIEMSYMIVESNDDICGKTVRNAGEYIPGNLVAGWFFGTLIVNPDPDTVIDKNSVLLTADYTDKNDEQERNNEVEEEVGEDRPLMIFGYGDVGKSVERSASQKGYETITVDISEENADIEADITDEEFVRNEANLDECRSVVVAVSDDDTAVYTNLVVSDISHSTDVITRSSKVDNIWKLYNAGSDFVLSLETITSDAILDCVSESNDIISSNDDVIVSSVSGQAYQGEVLENTDIREDFGTVFAIRRDGDIVTKIDGNTEIRSEDEIMYIGSQ